MTEKRAAKQNELHRPVKPDAQGGRHDWQRADDDHVRDMMRALVGAIEDSKKRPESQPRSDLW
jgi:hypothetical protein